MKSKYKILALFSLAMPFLCSCVNTSTSKPGSESKAVSNETFKITNCRSKSAKEEYGYHGYLEIVPEAEEGSLVTVQAHPDEGYACVNLHAYKTDPYPSPVSINPNNTFEMPRFDVSVVADFGAIHNIENLTPSEDSSKNNGYICVNATGVSGGNVKIETYPNAGYMVKDLIVHKKGEPENRVGVVNNQFTMPDFDISVKATFSYAYKINNLTPYERESIEANNGYVEIEDYAYVNKQVKFKAVATSKEYALSKIELYSTSTPDTPIVVTDNTFIMPDCDVTIKATFAKTYGITNMTSKAGKEIHHGYIEVPETAFPGSKVDIIIKAEVDSGYVLKSIKAENINDRSPVDIIDGKDGKYIIMPEFGILVEATFVIAK